MSIRYEVCVDSVEGVLAAERAGADRAELCANLFEGGTTPTLGTVVTTMAAVSSIRVHVIIRPRGGDFVFDRYEVDAMVRDVAAVREAGAHGVVIGALTPLERLVELGVHRVLTSGQEPSVLEGAPLIAELVKRAGDRIVVLPGGGITERNAARIVAETGVTELHFAAFVSAESPATHRNPHVYMGGELRQPEYSRKITSADRIAAVMRTP
ncbi:copper homeostasis protein [Herbihabitans rhizosphaerae]|uniref:Copper homeostasis protein cutC homolog n=1 Tax=Herbihabitans rhizosphaerae TaxID=1872711 RepID=A0A4Q7KHP0_9PSEU|nr:copper homeostasis protein CutC [Herbihabitans rhizosphaerae]RZS32388.1 copper homeostasis protein [Herbihabitans rhizosphaerae]